jgi:hypothetical protein
MTRPGAGALVVLASVLLVGATLAAYARLAIFDSEQFADRSAAALQDPGVRAWVGERVTDQLVLRNDQDLIAVRPLIASGVSGVVGGSAFAGLFRRAVLDAHRAIFAGDRDTVTLTLADVGTVVAAALEKLDPTLADELDAGERVVLVRENLGSLAAEAARAGRRVRILAWALALLSFAAAGAALARSADRRRTASQLGIGIACAGLAITIASTVVRAIAIDRLSGPDTRDATAGVYDAFLGDLRTFGWVLAGVGALVAAAAASLIRPVELEGALRRAWRVARTEPATAGWRLLRAAALAAAGVLLIAQPAAALQVAVTVLGVFLLYEGLETVLRMIYRPPDPDALPRRARRRHSGRIAVPVVTALLIGGAFAAFVLGGGTDAPAQAFANRCDGAAELCDRTLPEVVLPATHNSMSAPLPGWFSAEQERGIDGQLADGIRGLLLDTHYGDRLASGRVRTYFGSRDQLHEAATHDGVSPQAVDSALHLRERLGFRGKGRRGMYLCHSFCELGATPLADSLEDIHRFLATHPAEVVVMINQDYVKPADFVRAIGDAGLARYAFTPPAGDARWPTLREMIERDERLVMLAENHAGSAPWYQLAYERLTQETPFHFGSAQALLAAGSTCPPNRGVAGAPLFLLNHWVTTAPIQRPSDAAKVNAFAPLLERAQACRRIRDRLPNLLAVNFYKEGDVFAVADRLNGVDAGERQRRAG